jgi:hypothetical protein
MWKVKEIIIETGEKHSGNPYHIKDPVLVMKDPTNHLIKFEVSVSSIGVGKTNQVIFLKLKPDTEGAK